MFSQKTIHNSFNGGFVFQVKEPRLSKEHSHLWSDVAVEVVKTHLAMKDHATVSTKRPGQIIASHVAGTSDRVNATLPKKDFVKRALKYTQRGNVPVDPKSLKDFTVEDDFSLTFGVQRFLLYGSGYQCGGFCK